MFAVGHIHSNTYEQIQAQSATKVDWDNGAAWEHMRRATDIKDKQTKQTHFSICIRPALATNTNLYH